MQSTMKSNLNTLGVDKLVVNSQAVELCLKPNEVIALEGDRRGVEIVSGRGILWITQDGDYEDHIFNPGERFTITRRGPVLIEGMSAIKDFGCICCN